MNTKCTVSYWQLLSAILLTVMSNNLLAADCPADIKAVTDKGTNVSIDVLTYLVQPLSKCELEAEAQAWLGLLQKNISKISNTQIAAIYVEDEIDAEKEVSDSRDDIKEADQDVDLDTSREEKIEDKKEARQSLREAKKEAKSAENKLENNSFLQKIIDDVKISMAEQARIEKEDLEKAKIAKAKIKKAADDAKSSEGKKAEAITQKDKVEEDEPKEEKSEEEIALDKKEDLKIALIEHVTELTTYRTKLIDRFNIVLADLKAKGGETEEYETYITAISGLKVDVTDASATWTTITGWLMSAEGGLRWALNLLQFIVILVVFYLLSIIAGKAASKTFSKSKHFSALLRDFMVMATRRIVFLIGLFIGLSALEINIGPVLAIVGAAGFVIAFALQNSLSNFASGLLMLIYRPFDLGDMISVAGTVGVVDSMNLLSTQLRMADNQLVIVPNNSVWGDVIINITGISRRRVDLVFGIGYNDDIDKAQKILQDIVETHEQVLKEPEPMVKLHELADSSVNFICRPWVRPDDYWDVYWDVTREVKRRFDAEGISIPFPQQDVHIYRDVIDNK